MKLLRRAGYVAGGLMLVMVGVNIAPTVYGWQGEAYEWATRRAAPVDDDLAAVKAQREFVAEELRYLKQKSTEIKELREEMGRMREEAQPAAHVPPETAPGPPPVTAPPPEDLLVRMGQLERDHQELVRLQMDARRELLELADKPAVPRPAAAPGPDGDGPDAKLAALAERAGAEEPRSTIRNPRRPTTVNNRQRAWVQQLDNYKELRRGGMSDLQMLNRFGWAGVWEMSDKPTQCEPGDPNCPVHRGR